ncbi:MAG: NADPH-dependent assimilatory sulfite reductase hemoprotein subunit [Thermoguttaceae bacterium]|jgi:sulfite reductase (ferredoxin)
MDAQSPQPAGSQPSRIEKIKAESDYLRGRIIEELADPSDQFSDESTALLRFHGVFQQEDRDRRRQLGDPSRKLESARQFMVRSVAPGGRLSSDQLLAHLDLCDELGGGHLRITGRQQLQLYGIRKQQLRSVLRRINASGLTTAAGGGDVLGSVTCCPAPHRGDPVHGEMQWLAARLADALRPRMPAYREIWLGAEQPPAAGRPGLGGGGVSAAAEGPRGLSQSSSACPPGQAENGTVPFQSAEVEPLYGKTYLPRKFKVAVGLPGDNCVDLYAQDVGLMAVCENYHVVGYNVLVGGGMGMTPARPSTFPALAQRLAFTWSGQAVEVVAAILKVFRDFGNRADRRRARLKYLLADWGLERFKARVEAGLGYALAGPRPDEVWDIDDHLGWREQGDGRWFYGLHVEGGRITDAGRGRLKSVLREICQRQRPAIHLTPGRSIIFGDVPWEERLGMEDLLRRHGVRLEVDLSNVRRWSAPCVGLPTCPQAVTESERALPAVVDALESELARLGLAQERFSLRMTGCANGCSRPYSADVGIVGRAAGRYAIYLGGRRTATRLGFLFRDGVPLEQLVATLTPVLAYFRTARDEGETLGDFCNRKGRDDLLRQGGGD